LVIRVVKLNDQKVSVSIYDSINSLIYVGFVISSVFVLTLQITEETVANGTKL